MTETPIHRLRRGHRRPVPAPPTVALTSCADQVEHRVTVEVLEGATSSPGTALVACCGAHVLPAPLSAPPGRVCRSCAETGDPVDPRGAAVWLPTRWRRLDGASGRRD